MGPVYSRIDFHDDYDRMFQRVTEAINNIKKIKGAGNWAVIQLIMGHGKLERYTEMRNWLRHPDQRALYKTMLLQPENGIIYLYFTR